MSKFNQDSFDHFVLENKIIGFFEEPITLKSGRKSSYYVNWRIAAEDVFLIDQLSNHVLAFVNDLYASGRLSVKPDCFYGVPEGATKLGVLAQYKWAMAAADYAKGSHVLAMGRAKPKDHGHPRDRYYVGMPQGATVVLEDVTTTGLSILDTIDKLIESGVHIVAAMGLTDRMERRDDGKTVAEAIAERISDGSPVPYFSLSQSTTLLPKAASLLNPTDAIINAVRHEFEEHGTAGIKL